MVPMEPTVFSRVVTPASPTLSRGRQLSWSVDGFSVEVFWFTPNGYSQQLTAGKSMWGLECRMGRGWDWGGDRDGLICLFPTTSCTHRGYTVHLGKHALGRVENGEQAMEVVRSIPHPDYQVSPTHLNHDHDIMLLELKSPVKLSSHIRALPLSPDDCLPTGTCCRVSGWGTTTSPQGKCCMAAGVRADGGGNWGSHKQGKSEDSSYCICIALGCVLEGRHLDQSRQRESREQMAGFLSFLPNIWALGSNSGSQV